MDINYNIETWMSSLRKMCIVSVTQNILEIARCDPLTMDVPKFITSKAAEMVPELNLPQMLNTEIVAIIRPVIEEMLRWYERYGDVARVILTSHGTVDWTRSARAIIASDKPVYQRYVIACEHCLEDDIFTLGKQVTSVMLRERSKPLANFWYDVYGGNFDVKFIGGSLTQGQVVKGWLLAERYHNISSKRYFQEKATQKSIRVVLSRTRNYESTYPKYSAITPALCNSSLRANALDSKWKDKRKGSISTCLLLLLIEWPYQHLFLESAELLMPNLLEHDFWHIARSISEKLLADYKEYDYRSLFVRFWYLSFTRFKSMLLDDCKEFIISLLENLVLVKDEFLVSLVLDQISKMDEDYLNYDLTYVCFKLLYHKAYESVECLMRLLRKKYREVFLKFQNAFNRELIDEVLEDFNYDTFDRITGMEDDSFLDRYEQSMSKYWVLPELE